MKSNHQLHMEFETNSASELCAEFGPEDGVDSRYLYKRKTVKKEKQNTSRMCSEVAKVLSLVLNAELGSPLLQSLQVTNVLAECNGQFLCVYVSQYEEPCGVEVTEIISELKNIQGYLRSTIAQRINRKRVPALKFFYAGLLGKEE